MPCSFEPSTRKFLNCSNRNKVMTDDVHECVISELVGDIPRIEDLGIDELIPGRVLFSRLAMRKMVRDMRQTLQTMTCILLQEEIVGLQQEYSKSGWDGEDAAPVSSYSLKTALRNLPSIVRVGCFPDVTLDKRGRVCFQWGSVYDSYFLIKFGENGGCSCFLKKSGEEQLIIRKFQSDIEGSDWLCRLQLP